jgi:hypothetical protein
MLGIPEECLAWFATGLIAGGLIGIVSALHLAMRK